MRYVTIVLKMSAYTLGLVFAGTAVKISLERIGELYNEI